MSDDLVERLRAAERNPYGNICHPDERVSIAGAAAQEIERLRAENDALRARIEGRQPARSWLADQTASAGSMSKSPRILGGPPGSASPWCRSMSDLIRKLDRLLTGPNPVAYHKLTPDEWAELRALLKLEDAK